MRLRRTGLLAVLLALTALAAPPVAAQSKSSAEVVRALLALHEEDLGGRLWTHAELRGRITLIDFWATWCASSRREMPFLQRARELYGAEFEVIGISLDKSSRRELRAWMRREGMDWPQIHADGGFDDRLAEAFGVDRLPLNFLLDQRGRLRAMNVRGERLFVEIENLRLAPSERGVPER